MRLHKKIATLLVVQRFELNNFLLSSRRSFTWKCLLLNRKYPDLHFEVLRFASFPMMSAQNIVIVVKFEDIDYHLACVSVYLPLFHF